MLGHNLVEVGAACALKDAVMAGINRRKKLGREVTTLVIEIKTAQKWAAMAGCTMQEYYPHILEAAKANLVITDLEAAIPNTVMFYGPNEKYEGNIEIRIPANQEKVDYDA